MSIHVITPCGSTLYAETALCLEANFANTPGMSTVKARGTSGLHDRLNSTVKACLERGAKHIGIAEADMTFPSTAFSRLLKHHRDIVGANYWQRMQHQWTASALNSTEFLSSEGRTGLERVNWLGCGVMLIDARVFKVVPMPWFSDPWKADAGIHQGIDAYFGSHCSEFGVWSWVDHDLSQEVEHIGEVAYGVKGPRYLHTQEPICPR